MEKKQLAKEILDYWYKIEALKQNNFPIEDQTNKKRNELNTTAKISEDQSENSKMANQLTLFEVISDFEQKDFNLESILQKNKSTYSKYEETESVINVFMGEISRELCSDLVYEILKKSKNSPEKTKSKIALFYLQISQKGEYIQKSFKISPMLWGIRKIKNFVGEELIQQLSQENYLKEMKEYNDKLSSFDSISKSELLNVFYGIVDEFNTALSKDMNVNTKLCLIYKIYKDNDALLKDNGYFEYEGLNNSYILNDLHMLQKRLLANGLDSMIVDYIISLYAVKEENEKLLPCLKNRIDIRKFNAESKELYRDFFNLEKFPLGKWPCKFKPSLMQQLAINIAVEKGNTNTKTIHSVNGPPGTGKTTLLKEIIAHNIVSRAKLLSQYEKADDAFKTHHFKDGEEKDHGYSLYALHYHSFKNDDINNYSIVVASNNNDAVQNITLELPITENILRSLSSDLDKCKEYNDSLNKIHNYFDVNCLSNNEFYKKHDIEYELDNELYFSNKATELAKRLLNVSKSNSNEFPERWGLISAPLGKKSNITAFINCVLIPLFSSYKYACNRDVFKRNYEKCRKAFIEKFNELNNFIENNNKIYNTLQELRKKEKEYTYINSEEQSEIQQFECLIHDIDLDIENKLNEFDVLTKAFKELTSDKEIENKLTELKDVSNDYNSIKEELLLKKNDIESQLGFKDYIIKLVCKRNSAKMDMIEDINEKIQKNKDELSKLDMKLIGLSKQDEKHKNDIRVLQQKIEDLNYEIDSLYHNKEKHLFSIEFYEKKIKGRKKVISNFKSEIKTYLEDAKKQGIAVLDDDFFDRYDSDNVDEILSNELSNPYTTDKYDRLREELYFSALMLHKYFILSSKFCVQNLKNLKLLWIGDKDDDNLITMSEEDKMNSFSPLFQTLSLLVPVISTTFASAENMFKYMSKENQLGTLIIDEAGQAEPQMALGMMHRSRHTIVVGDPKQVEPVVLSDMDIIKQAIENDRIRYYRKKQLSVQQFADTLNPYGRYFKNSTDSQNGAWVGTPLVVHRRCIEPMFSISNKLSYNDTMLLQTEAPKDDIIFYDTKSKWINVGGLEKSLKGKDHYVKEQGEKVVEILKECFNKNKTYPDIFVITPFTSVSRGLRKIVENAFVSKLGNGISEWCKTNIGTIHTFQGKEANEVIFVLGCDSNAKGAIQWVNSNIVNVAVTRAKYRLYIIGDYTIWRDNEYVRLMKSIMDSFALNIINQTINNDDITQNKKDEIINNAVNQLPSSDSFLLGDEIDTSTLFEGIQKSNLLRQGLQEEQFKKYCLNKQDIKHFKLDAYQNLVYGLKMYEVYQILHNQYRLSDLDASISGILLCKAFEIQVRECFDAVKKAFYEKDKSKELGRFLQLFENKKEELANMLKDDSYDIRWWENFHDNFKKFKEDRNDCCHADALKLEKLTEMVLLLTKEQLFVSTLVGKKLEKIL